MAVKYNPIIVHKATCVRFVSSGRWKLRNHTKHGSERQASSNSHTTSSLSTYYARQRCADCEHGPFCVSRKHARRSFTWLEALFTFPLSFDQIKFRVSSPNRGVSRKMSVCSGAISTSGATSRLS